MLTRGQVLIIGVVGLAILLFIAFGIWWWFIRKPQSPSIGSECVATQPNTCCLSNGVVAAIEKDADDSMPTPTTTLGLQSFNSSPSFAPWCVPSYYAFCYVDTQGNYGPLSEWFGPVVASTKAVPGGCSANIPYLSVVDSTDPNLGKYYANVHRQDGDWIQGSNGTIVGMLYPISYSFVDDPSTNPNSDYSIFPCHKYGCS